MTVNVFIYLGFTVRKSDLRVGHFFQICNQVKVLMLDGFGYNSIKSLFIYLLQSLFIYLLYLRRPFNWKLLNCYLEISSRILYWERHFHFLFPSNFLILIYVGVNLSDIKYSFSMFMYVCCVCLKNTFNLVLFFLIVYLL